MQPARERCHHTRAADGIALPQNVRELGRLAGVAFARVCAHVHTDTYTGTVFCSPDFWDFVFKRM
eukprot:362748-Chlamydomonas_euryale.AAC.3